MATSNGTTCSAEKVLEDDRRITDDPKARFLKSSEIRRSESLNLRRHGRIAVPMITVQGADDTKSEIKFVSMFTKSDSLDTGLEKKFHSDMEFNIVVSPTKLVSLSKNTFVCNSKKGEISSKEETNIFSNGSHIKTGSESCELTREKNKTPKSATQNGEKHERAPNEEIVPERKVSVPKVRKSSIQSVGQTRRLSPVPYKIPGPAERKQSLTSLMDSGRKRRDSVAAMPIGKSVNPPSTRHRRVSLAPTPSIPKRRSSIKDTLSSYAIPPGSESSPTKRMREHLSKSDLPFGLDNEDFKTAKIERGKIEVSIPVFHINQNDTKVCITDLKAIEDAIHVGHPEVTVLKNEEKNGRPEYQSPLSGKFKEI